MKEFHFLFLIGMLAFGNLTIVAQSSIVFKLLDQSNEHPIAFAHVVNLTNEEGSLTNEDGFFKLSMASDSDSIFISHLGYVNTTIAIGSVNNVIYLTPNSILISEITIKARDELAYTLLANSKKKLKARKQFEAKCYLSLETNANDKPIEFLEGFYNASINKGNIDKLDLKAGKVALSKVDQRYFVSLNTTYILNEYSLLSNGILPLNPYDTKRLKKTYDLRIVDQNEDYTVLTFQPIKNKNKYFSGNLWLSANENELLKIELSCRGLEEYPFKPIKEFDKLDNVNVALVFNYQQTDQGYGLSTSQMSYDFDYYFIDLETDGYLKRKINSKCLLYAYEPYESFILPFYQYENGHDDYRLISFLGYDNEFWEENSRIISSEEQLAKIGYFKTNGILVNFDNNIFYETQKSTFFEDNNIKWDGVKRWALRPKVIDLNATDILPRSKIEVQLFLDVNETKDGFRYRSETILDIFKSKYYLENEPVNNSYLNLYFDLCEIHRRSLMDKLKSNMSIDEIKTAYNNQVNAMKSDIDEYKRKVNYGQNLSILSDYNEYVKSELSIDNFVYFNVIE
jgi:hypothetical protein